MESFFTKDVETYLQDLIGACGVSGNTDQVANLLKKRLDLSHIKIEDDPGGLGHVIAVVNPNKSFKVMLGAHMDVVGLRTTFIDSAGFVYFRSVGGIDLMAIKGHLVKIWTKKGPIPGLIQHVPIHHMEDDARRRVPDIDHFWVRTEFSGQAAQSYPISVGDPITLDGSVTALGPNLLVAPGFDDRIGLLVMSEVLRRLNPKNLKATVYGVGSSGEEIGCRGIRALTQKINPDLAIAIDITASPDYPGANIKKFGTQCMGKGPLLAIGYNTRTKYNEKLIELARELQIPVQLRAEDLTPTDGREMDEAGVPTIVIRLPGNMLHTTNDMVDRRDIESTCNLLFQFLQRLPY